MKNELSTSQMCGKEKIENCYILISGRRVARGDLVIDGKRIAAIEERDCKPDKLVMPGLVNCHGHTAMTLVRRLGGATHGWRLAAAARRISRRNVAEAGQK